MSTLRYKKKRSIYGKIAALLSLAASIITIFLFYRYCHDEGRYELKTTPDVFVSGRFGDGFLMGLDTSEHVFGWATLKEGDICIKYPGAQLWGTWYLSVGEPTEDKEKRHYMDFSGLSKMLIEVKGGKGEVVVVYLKDRDDINDGKESRYALKLRNDDWNTYEVTLKSFTTADLNTLHIVGFAFGPKPQTVYVRKITFQ